MQTHPAFSPSTGRAFVLAALLGLGAAAPQNSGRAATYTWDGGGANGNWATAANWLTDTVPPSSFDTALVFAGTSQLSSQQNVLSAFILNSLSFDPTAGAFVLGGNRIDFFSSGGVNPAITQNSAASIVVNNPMRLNALTTIGGPGNLTLAGTFDNNAGIIKTGAGTLTLAGANNFATPGLTLQGGVVTVANAGALGTSGTLAFTGGTLQYSSANTTDYSSRFSPAAGQAYSIDTNGQNVTFAAPLTSSGGTLTKLGTGTLTLAGASTFAGPTAFAGANPGTLTLANRFALQNSTLVTNGGTVVFDAGVVNGLFAVGGLAGTGSLALVTNAATPTGVSLEVGGNNANTTYAGSISGAGGLLSKVGTGTLTLTGANTYSSSTQVIAGTLDIEPGGSITSSYVGIGTGGTLTINGGSVTATVSGFTVGASDGTALAAANLISGSLSTSQLAVGYSGGSNAAFAQTGGTVNASTLRVGNNIGDTGTYALGGTGSLNVNTAYVGYNGTGTFTQTAGNVAALNGGFYLAYNAGSTGTYNFGGTGSLNVNTAYVGYNGTGTFTQTGGTVTTLNGGILFLAYNTGSTGTYTLGGTGSLSTSTAHVGFGGTGAFVQNGGTFTTNGGNLYIGYNTFTDGSIYTLNAGTLTTNRTQVSDQANRSTFTQTGGTHTTGTLSLSGYQTASTGIYNLDGGTLNARLVTTGDFNVTGTSLFNFNGGTLRPTASSATFLQGLTTASVRAGGARIDTAGFNITIAQPLVHDATPGAPGTDGGLTKLGAGTLTLTGANTFTGPVSINAGTLSTASESSLGAGGTVTLGGSGQLLFTGSPTLTRTYDLGTATLAAAAGTTLTFGSGATVNGGFLGGAGTDAFIDGSSLNAASTTIGSTLTTAGTVAFTNDTLRGSVTQTGTLNAVDTVISSAGSLTVNSTVAATGLENDGVLAVNGTLADAGAPLALGGGSRTTINAPGKVSAAAGTSIELNGALLVNNGTQPGALAGVVHVNYGSSLKGSGDFSAANITVGDGGQFGNNGLSGGAPLAALAAPAPGASPFWQALQGGSRAGGSQPFIGPQLNTTPQVITVGGLTLGANSTFNFNLQNTQEAAGVGYDLTHAGSGGLTLNGGTTPGTQIVIRLIGLDANGNNGPVGNFDAAQPYQFTLVTSDGGITGYQPGEFLVNTANFSNATDGGAFSVVQQGNNLVLVFAPVPEPAAWVLSLVGLGGGWLLAVRRRRGGRARAGV